MATVHFISMTKHFKVACAYILFNYSFKINTIETA